MFAETSSLVVGQFKDSLRGHFFNQIVIAALE